MVPCTIHTVHTTYAAVLKTTTHPKTRCRKPYAATQHLMLLMMGVWPETCRAKTTSIKLLRCIKLAFHFISWGRHTVKQPSCFKFVVRSSPNAIDRLFFLESRCNESHTYDHEWKFARIFYTFLPIWTKICTEDFHKRVLSMGFVKIGPLKAVFYSKA